MGICNFDANRQIALRRSTSRPFCTQCGSSLLTPALPTVLAISEMKNDLTVILILSETGRMNIYLTTIFFLYCELMV